LKYFGNFSGGFFGLCFYRDVFGGVDWKYLFSLFGEIYILDILGKYIGVLNPQNDPLGSALCIFYKYLAINIG